MIWLWLPTDACPIPFNDSWPSTPCSDQVRKWITENDKRGKKSLLVHVLGCWLSRGSWLGGGGLGTKTRLKSRSWSLTRSMLGDFCTESQFLVRFAPPNLKPAMRIQAWGRMLPQHGSAVDCSVCADRSNWRVQAKTKTARDKTATAGGLTTCHFWSFPASHHCCHTS